ncbi:hypothetical protein TSUD_128610 [Trifolium subterraneum]|uniref:Reverse transcriptase zinc-binding domain-containing protein n=1 Tax=Trifolium subterraneum TaxID=3900 RepID=A0A2Z6LXB2_TRISU|nr:hypothetical protein TSUD_128610 [Trifolium subterraneum]
MSDIMCFGSGVLSRVVHRVGGETYAKEALVSEIRVGGEGVSRWEWGWRRSLFVWEEELLLGLLDFISPMAFSTDDDVWYWGLEDGGVFTVKSWLGVVIVMPPNLFSLFDCFVGAAGCNKMAKGFSLIWHTTVWAIWRSRNDILFANGVLDPSSVIDEIKLLSWRWGLIRQKIPMCLLYEWCWDPGICLRR